MRSLSWWGWSLARWRAWRHTPALRLAIVSADTPAAIAALARGADPCVRVPEPGREGEFLEPALVHAARANDVDLVQALLAHGADIEDRGEGNLGHSALATAVLARRWATAQVLSLAGASWETPVRFISADALAAAMVMGGLDPRRVRPGQATLAAVVLGQVQDMGHYHRNQSTWLHDQPQARQLYAQSQAMGRAQALDDVLVQAPSPDRPVPRL